MVTILHLIRSPRKLYWGRANWALSCFVDGLLFGSAGWPAVSPFIWISFGFSLITLCFVVALLPTMKERYAAKQEERIGTVVSQLSNQLGFDLDHDWSSQIDELVRNGKIIQAVKLYHQKLGVTWEEANNAICLDWPKKKLELELRAILTHLQSARPVSSTPLEMSA